MACGCAVLSFVCSCEQRRRRTKGDYETALGFRAKPATNQGLKRLLNDSVQLGSFTDRVLALGNSEVSASVILSRPSQVEVTR